MDATTNEMPTSLKSQPIIDPDFVCGCEQSLRLACNGLPYYKDYQDKQYCVLHFPGDEKSANFKKAVKVKIDKRDFCFRGVWFPEADFRGVTFRGEADFKAATFNGDANFRKATFNSEADFSNATFNGVAAFSSAIFNEGAVFQHATFKERGAFREAAFNGLVDFTNATFKERAAFGKAQFNRRADFSWATFKEYVKFEEAIFAGTSSLSLQFARIDEPEHVFFYSLTMCPYWFVNTDARQFHFMNVRWNWRSIPEEVESLRKEFLISEPHQLLSIAYRHLAVNAEESHRYEEASNFRYRAMDVGRREHWHGFAFWRLSWWYWLASGYGERIWQAAVVLVGLSLLFACIFFVGQRNGQWWRHPQSNGSASAVESPVLHDFPEAVIYSFAVMTLQKPEPLPANKQANTFVLLATILGPLQAALLALAIRRKFTR